MKVMLVVSYSTLLNLLLIKLAVRIADLLLSNMYYLGTYFVIGQAFLCCGYFLAFPRLSSRIAAAVQLIEFQAILGCC